METCDHALGWDIVDYEGGWMRRASDLLPGGEYAPGGAFGMVAPYSDLAQFDDDEGFHLNKFCPDCGEEIDHSKYNTEHRQGENR